MKFDSVHLPARCFRLLSSLRGHDPALYRSRAAGPAAALALLTAGSLLAAALPAARAQSSGTLTTLYTFSSTGGAYPDGGLAAGTDGNFYGTTAGGGDANDDGTIYVITPAGALTTLYTFNGTDGSDPEAAPVEGSDGNFYGTTVGGGDANGDGTIYQITPAGVLTVLHTFNGTDGASPAAALVQGSDGSFYGTAYVGGDANGDGTIFKITPTGTFTVLHTFNGSDGANPAAALLLGHDGNFYGTTAGTGDGNSFGTVFQITPAGVLTNLLAFDNTNGNSPAGALVLGGDGNFYGTTYDSAAGDTDDGEVFKITPTGALTVLSLFDGNNGYNPSAGLVLGGDGNFYGTTSSGGDTNDDGTVFQITPAGVLTTIHFFAGTDGSMSLSSLVAGAGGSFYGTTSAGGPEGLGTIFKLTVGAAPAHPAFFTGEAALDNGVYYLSFPSGNYFGYYSFLSDPNYIYHFDLGYEYVFDANDSQNGVYFYDFTSSDYFYTSPTFPFPYLFDFGLNSVVYYYPDPNDPGHYNTNGVRYFYVFSTGQIIAK